MTDVPDDTTADEPTDPAADEQTGDPGVAPAEPAGDQAEAEEDAGA